jgi:hypothetical protein
MFLRMDKIIDALDGQEFYKNFKKLEKISI